MKTKLVRIGNSRGVRIPKALIEEAGLTEEIEMRVVDGAIVIESRRAPRDGWAEAAARAREAEDAGALEEWPATEFEEREWEWE